MQVHFPEPPRSIPAASYLVNLTARLREYFLQVVDQQTAVSQFFLISPGGKVYKVTVSDTGVLTTTHVQG